MLSLVELHRQLKFVCPFRFQLRLPVAGNAVRTGAVKCHSVPNIPIPCFESARLAAHASTFATLEPAPPIHRSGVSRGGSSDGPSRPSHTASLPFSEATSADVLP
eukprot:COSAG02_NODE_123_length_35269_cov_51.697526_11_plen_105_part_00